MAARPLVAVQRSGSEESKEQVTMPFVLLSPIRPDIVQAVHKSMNKNKRQAYAVYKGAGHQHSAESWGTGRAVSRIPRVSGGGTSRAGQAAFGNMCRSGRMFNPTTIWRKWHRKINTNQKRYAVASALAASALPSLVMARGHRIEECPEIPLVVDAAAESFQRTKQAIAALKQLGVYADVEKCKASRQVRRGKGKMRNRRYTQRRGPLVVYKNDNGIVQSFRNLSGVETCNVESLNLLQLAPGGHVGRLIVWTQPAFESLNSIWGSAKGGSKKKGYNLPRTIMTNSDLTRIINSDEVQSKVRPAVKDIKRAERKKNPLKNLGAKVRLNPYAVVLRRAEIAQQANRKSARAQKVAAARAKAAKAAKKAHKKEQQASYARISAE